MTIAGVVLDHVAVAVESWTESWPRYVGALGGEWHSGGWNVGFAPHQLRYANDARLEVLQPWEPEHNPFLRRFLDANGPGPHHLTFKVPDLAGALAEAEAAGLRPVSVDMSDPGWMEGFLHPKQATGVVVQLAQASGTWISPEPEGFPTARPAVPAALTHVTHAVPRLDDGLAIFGELLGGEQVRRDDADDGSWESVTLGWGGPLLVCLVAPAGAARDGALTRWIGDRPGRVHHLAFSQPAPVTRTVPDVPGVAGPDQPVEVVEPEENLGTRLVLSRHP